MKTLGLVLILLAYPCLLGAFLAATPLQPWVYLSLTLLGAVGVLLLLWR